MREGRWMTTLWARPIRRRWVAATIVVALVPFAWQLLAYPRGALAAWFDGRRGHDEVQRFGLRAPSAGESARLLRERYGVETRRVAGCVVESDLIAYVRGYNAVVVDRVNERFGRDVFAECDADAERAVEAGEAAEDARRPR